MAKWILWDIMVSDEGYAEQNTKAVVTVAASTSTATQKSPAFKTAQEIAEAWGVSKRWVTMCAAGGRIPGAVRMSNIWLIPWDAQKPADARRAAKPSAQVPQPCEPSALPAPTEPLRPSQPCARSRLPLSRDLLNILAATMGPMPWENPDAVLDTLHEPRLRLHYEGELAYLRGDFPRVIACFRRLGQDDAAKLRACSLTIAAAISLGDYALYTEIDTYLRGIMQASHGGMVTAVADCARNLAFVSAIAPAMISPWLVNGDFSALPPQVRMDAAYKRAKYFQGLGQFESMLAVAQTALSLCEVSQGILYAALYLRVLCAIACAGLGREAEATHHLRSALAMALPHGFITPFAESAPAFGGLLETLLKREYSSHLEAVTAQWQRSFQHWIAFHNQFTKDNITSVLSLRHYEIASLVARRVARAKIAKQLNLSPARLNNILQEIFSILMVTNREQLSELIL